MTRGLLTFATLTISKVAYPFLYNYVKKIGLVFTNLLKVVALLAIVCNETNIFNSIFKKKRRKKWYLKVYCINKI